MQKLNLAALCYDRDAILNALQRTGAVEIKAHAEAEGATRIEESGEELRAYYAAVENALETLVSAYERSGKKSENKSAIPADGFSVTYAEFIAASEKRVWADALIQKLNALTERKNAAVSEQARLSRAVSAAEPYAETELKFSELVGTQHTAVRFGLVAAASWEALKKSLEELELAAFEYNKSGEWVVLTVVAHKSAVKDADALLGGAGFSSCPYGGDMTGGEQLDLLKAKLEAEKAKELEAEEEIFAMTGEIRELKIYCDYIGFEVEKAEAASNMCGTERTFLLEAFVPESEKQKVAAELDKTGFATWYEFSEPEKDEEVPTLLKNNAAVKNFEAITNMYSPPNAREFDPNTVMAFFYSVFMGFIMGDVGYGLAMLLGGGLLWLKGKKGMKSLAGVFAIGGIFAIVWGVLFNSVFGVKFLPFTVMPDAQNAMWTLVGIKIPSVLIIAMLLGIFQLLVGYACRAWQEWRVGNFFDGLFDGAVWAVFSVGVGVAVVGLVEEFGASNLAAVGGIIALGALVVAILTAGRHEKFLGKFTKGFGAAYGIINYVSDVLSYARLYGLMLSGAVIAQIISQYALTGGEGITPLIGSGNAILIVLGVFLLVVGHVFNLAMGLLGAYIHDARLQYVEFYGRFFVGDGELFAPLGSKCKHVCVE